MRVHSLPHPQQVPAKEVGTAAPQPNYQPYSCFYSLLNWFSLPQSNRLFHVRDHSKSYFLFFFFFFLHRLFWYENPVWLYGFCSPSQVSWQRYLSLTTGHWHCRLLVMTPSLWTLWLAVRSPFQMGNQSSIQSKSLLGYILVHWTQFDPQTQKKQVPVFFCNTVWTLYKLPNGEIWPINGNINYDIILQLDLYFKQLGKWLEVPYVQAYFLLWENNSLLKKCKLTTLALIHTNLPLLKFPQLNP